MLKAIALAFFLSLPGLVLADSTMHQLRNLEGYTIAAVTAVDGEFQGCDFGRVIKLQNGSVYKCSTYSYTYSYSPDAVVFAKVSSFQGKSVATVKLLVEGEIFDMESVFLK